MDTFEHRLDAPAAPAIRVHTHFTDPANTKCPPFGFDAFLVNTHVRNKLTAFVPDNPPVLIGFSPVSSRPEHLITGLGKAG
jgi:hypothetical protein